MYAVHNIIFKREPKIIGYRIICLRLNTGTLNQTLVLLIPVTSEKWTYTVTVEIPPDLFWKANYPG